MISDEIREQHKKLKNAPLRKKLSYFFHYYFLWTVLIIAAAVCVILLAKAFLQRKTNAFSAVFLNSETNDANQGDTLKETLDKTWGLSSHEAIDLDFTSTLTPGGSQDETDMGTITKLAAAVREKSLDAMVCDAWNFNHLADQSMFSDLRKHLSKEELIHLQGRIYYIDGAALNKKEEITSESREDFKLPDPTSMKDPIPVGVILSDSNYLKDNSLYQKTVPIFGFTNTGKHGDRAKDLLSILLK
ncbi:hypothetical protein ACKX2D_02570 [Lachnospiraceae bacterium YH-ros2226]